MAKEEEVTPKEEVPEEQVGLDTSEDQEVEVETPPVEPEKPEPAQDPAYVKLLEETVREQAARLNAEARRAVDSAPPPKEPEAEVDFFSDPAKATAQVVRTEMEKMIRPFREDLGRGREAEARDRMSRNYGKDWEDLESTVDVLMQRSNVELPTDPEQAEGVLNSYFFMAKGIRAHQQESAPVTETKPQPKPAPAAPPQHRPSSAPLPDTSPKAQLRELTENERRLAREQGMSHSEYIAWADADIGEVVDFEYKEESNG